MSILSKNPIQHWLDTPLGSYEGYPSYGNSIGELLFKNTQDSDAIVGVIIDQIEAHLGTLIASQIESISMANDEDKNDFFYIFITTKDKNLLIGEYNV